MGLHDPPRVPTLSAQPERAVRFGPGPLALLGLAVAAATAWRVPLALQRNYDPDEFQHLHGAYCAVRGLVAYRDYFEHHPPGCAWLLAPLVEHFGESWRTVQAARGVAFMAALGVLMATVALGRRTVGLGPALLAALFLAATPLFVDKTLEVRPDGPAALLWLLGLLGFVHGGRRAAVAGGLALGLGLMFTPKLAFGALGAVLAIALTCRRSGCAGELPRLARFTAAAFVPLALVLAALALRGAAGAFVRDVVVGPLGWPRELSPWRFSAELARGSPALVGLGLLGLGHFTLGSPGPGRCGAARSAPGHGAPPDADRDRARRCVAGAAAGFLVGWFTVPVPWPQFLVPLLPLVALGAAHTLTELAAAVAARRPRGADALACGALVGVAAVAALAVRGFAGDRRLALVYAALVAASAAPWVAALARGRSAAGVRLTLAAAALALAVPLYRVVDRIRWRDTAVRQEFAALHAHTGPDDTVLSGWSAPTMFRPHAYRYFFLHPGMLAALDAEAKGPAVLRILREQPPAIVVRDDATRGLSAEVNAYLDAHYHPLGVGVLWQRQAAGD